MVKSSEKPLNGLISAHLSPSSTRTVCLTRTSLGIDNIIVEVDAPEIPIMDGSAAPFIYLLMDAGIEQLNSAKKFVRVKQTVRVAVKRFDLGPFVTLFHTHGLLNTHKFLRAVELLDARIHQQIDKRCCAAIHDRDFDQAAQSNKEPDYLDIPAFLRKQAD